MITCSSRYLAWDNFQARRSEVRPLCLKVKSLPHLISRHALASMISEPGPLQAFRADLKHALHHGSGETSHQVP